MRYYHAHSNRGRPRWKIASVMNDTGLSWLVHWEIAVSWAEATGTTVRRSFRRQPYRPRPTCSLPDRSKAASAASSPPSDSISARAEAIRFVKCRGSAETGSAGANSW